MKISRVTIITLGVANLTKATAFYEAVLETPPRTAPEITFIELPGTWIALYPIDKLAEDIASEIRVAANGFSGITLAHNAGSKDDVVAIMRRAALAGARVVKQPQETFWGGFSGYFADLDGHYWEVAWGPMFEFDARGEMKFQDHI